MNNSSKYNFPNVQKVQIFEQVDTYIENQNPSDVTNTALLKQIADLQQFITDLEIQHPNPAGEEAALAIVGNALTEIQTQQPDRWQKICHQTTIFKQQLLNPQRHLQASKATLVEVTKAAWGKSLIVKAVITYLDKFSETPDKGV
jgi:patatin-like phospholipase/acyl hydrolase